MLRLLRFCICLPLLSAQEVDFDQAGANQRWMASPTKTWATVPHHYGGRRLTRPSLAFPRMHQYTARCTDFSNTSFRVAALFCRRFCYPDPRATPLVLNRIPGPNHILWPKPIYSSRPPLTTPREADEACESETCQVSLRQLRAEKLQALGLSAGNAEASSATAQTEAPVNARRGGTSPDGISVRGGLGGL